MIVTHSRMRLGACATGCAIAALVIPWSTVRAGKPVHETVAAQPEGAVEVVDVTGDIEIIGWDRPEITVDGKIADSVDRVDVTSSGSRSSVHVVTRKGWNWGGGDDTRLTVHVPAKSALSASLVSADVKVRDVRGDVMIQTVSGEISGEVGGDLHVSGVSGDVRVRAPAAQHLEVKTLSGDIELTGGGGEVDITTISGDAKIELDTLKRGHFKSVSGDMSVGLALAPDGQIDGQSVSGTLHFNFANQPDAQFDVQTITGDIANCFGEKPMESRYGPGSRLSFKSGDGKGSVRVDTKSGDVRVCNRNPRTSQLCPNDEGMPTDGHGVPTGEHRDGLMMALLARTHFRPML
jgi:hypothetical protein